jgi:serine protease inhibitor
MIVDRPFFFAIVDQKTNEIMFVGAIVDPEKAVAPGASRYISVR